MMSPAQIMKMLQWNHRMMSQPKESFHLSLVNQDFDHIRETSITRIEHKRWVSFTMSDTIRSGSRNPILYQLVPRVAIFRVLLDKRIWIQLSSQLWCTSDIGVQYVLGYEFGTFSFGEG